MKRLFLSIIAIITVFGMSMRAQETEDFSYTIQWDTPGAVTIAVKDIMSDPVAIDPSATSYTVTQRGYSYIRPAKGYIIKKVTDNEGKDYKISGYQYYGGQYVSLNYYGIPDGTVFTVETEKLEKTGEFELDIINGEYALTAYLSNGEDAGLSTFSTPELIKGKQAVVLTAYDNILVVAREDGKPVFSIKRNGEDVPTESTSTVKVENGDKIEVRTYEEEPVRVAVKIGFTEGSEGCLNFIYNQANMKLIMYPAIEAAGNVLECNAGSSLLLNFNEDFIINSVKVNGTPAELPAGTAPFRITVEEDTEILIGATAKVYEDIEGVVYVSGPIDGLRFATGIMEYDVEIAISEGEELTEDVVFTYSNGKTFTIPAGTAKRHTLMMPGKSHKFFFDALPGYWIIDRILANPDDPEYTTASLGVLAENAPLYIKVAPISNDTKAVVYYEGEEDAASFYAQNVRFPGRMEVDGINGRFLPEGYSVIEFDAGYHETFSVGKSGGLSSNEILAFLDGKKLKYNEDSMSYTGFKLGEGSVLKVFSVKTGTNPAVHSVKFEIDNGIVADVVYDMVKPHDPASELECIGKTLISVKPTGDAEVTLDGEPLEANEDGRYEFMTSKSGHQLKIGEKAGITDIKDGGTAEKEIYTLQGIKAQGTLETLPAGIYIVGGRKVVKR